MAAEPLFDELDLPDELRGRIKSELAPGERLLWAGRAMARPAKVGCGYVVGSLIALALLSLGGWLFTMTLGAPAGSDPVVPALFCLGIGAFIFFVMFVNWRSQKSNQARIAQQLYALTDRRAILWKPVWQAAIRANALEIHSIEQGRVEKVHRLEYPDGSGDVIFTLPGRGNVNYDPDFVPERVGFLSVPEVRRVEDLVRRTLLPPDPGIAFREPI